MCVRRDGGCLKVTPVFEKGISGVAPRGLNPATGGGLIVCECAVVVARRLGCCLDFWKASTQESASRDMLNGSMKRGHLATSSTSRFMQNSEGGTNPREARSRYTHTHAEVSSVLYSAD